MQDVFRRATEGQRIFRSDSDWQAYAKGYTTTNETFVRHASSLDAPWRRSTARRARTEEKEEAGEELDKDKDDAAAFAAAMAESYVWMDFISIPQNTTSYSPYTDVATKLRLQQLAIRSIPAYVELADNFWVCCPSGTPHADSGHICDYATWASRGWCRLEETCLALAKAGDGRPLLVTQPLGDTPRITVLDSMDRLTVHTQRHSSVLTGGFSCCRLGHQLTSADGKKVAIACDKPQLKQVLTDLYQVPTAHCLLLATYCLRPTTYCLPPTTYYLTLNHSPLTA